MVRPLARFAPPTSERRSGGATGGRIGEERGWAASDPPSRRRARRRHVRQWPDFSREDAKAQGRDVENGGLKVAPSRLPLKYGALGVDGWQSLNPVRLPEGRLEAGVRTLT